jgi:hypothetical protein
MEMGYSPKQVLKSMENPWVILPNIYPLAVRQPGTTSLTFKNRRSPSNI